MLAAWLEGTPGGCKGYEDSLHSLGRLQALALDALAAWLEEDAGRLQPRLATRDTLARLTALLASHTPAGAPPSLYVELHGDAAQAGQTFERLALMLLTTAWLRIPDSSGSACL